MLGNIVAVAQANADFSILMQAVTRANLAGALQASTPRKTVFAPTNAAFTALFTQLGVTGVADLSVDQLNVILKYHVLPTEVTAAAAAASATSNAKVDSLGGKIQLSLQGTTLRLDSRASVTTADVAASNGLIHAIDQVLLPSLLDVATTDERFSSLAAAVVASNQPALVGQLDDNAQTPKLTVLAPTNSAFDAFVASLRGTDDGGTTGVNALTSFSETQLRPVLAYHVISGEVPASAVPASGTVATLGGKVAVTRTGATVTVDGVQVVIADIRTSNGIIHAIGSVLLPSIADIATAPASAGNFSSLAAAIAVADPAQADGGANPTGLAAMLDAPRADGGLFTVFAPTNAAFAATVTALRGTDDGGTTGITSLGSFAAAQVAPILRYHVVPARVLASQMPETVGAVDTLGGKVRAVRTGAAVTIDGKAVTAANIFASNGVVHVLSDVLLPSIADVVTTEPALSTLASLVAGAPTVATALDGTSSFTLFAPSNAGLIGVTPPTGQPLTDLLLFHAGTSAGTTGSPIYANTVLGLSSQVELSTALASRTLAVGPVNGTVRVAPIAIGLPIPTLSTANAQVVTPNLFTSNGVIHVISGVLVP